MIDEEKYLTALESMDPVWTSEDADQLQAALGQKPIMKALASIMTDGLIKANRLTNINLGTAEGIQEATKIQGEILGMNLVISRLVMLTQKEEADGESRTEPAGAAAA